jgi:hypothetical protein
LTEWKWFIPSKFCYFRPPDHVISMKCTALDFRCQCTHQKLQSISAVLTFDPQLKSILAFSVKDIYQLDYFICIKDFNAETITSLKLNIFFSLFAAVSIMKGKRSTFMYIFLIYQTVRYQTPVCTQPFPWRLHITITCNIPYLRLWYADVITLIAWTPEVVCRAFQTSGNEKDGTWSELTWFETTVFIILFSSFWTVDREKIKIL